MGLFAIGRRHLGRFPSSVSGYSLNKKKFKYKVKGKVKSLILFSFLFSNHLTKREEVGKKGEKKNRIHTCCRHLPK